MIDDYEYYRNLLKKPAHAPPYVRTYTRRQVTLVKNALFRYHKLKTVTDKEVDKCLHAMLERDPGLYDEVIEEYENYRIYEDEMRMEAWDAYNR